jgi:hypothetical protein
MTTTGQIRTFTGTATSNAFVPSWETAAQPIKPITATAVVEGLIGGYVAVTAPASCTVSGSETSGLPPYAWFPFSVSGVGSVTVNPVSLVSSAWYGTVTCSGGVTLSGRSFSLTSIVEIEAFAIPI